MTLKRTGTVPLATLLLAGCLSAPLPQAGESTLIESGADVSVVVALVDSGINPYHQAFRAPGFELPPHVLEAGPAPVDLTFGQSWDSSFAADSEFWDNIELGKLYWFRNTRVLGVAMSDPAASARLIDRFRHGTGAANAVLEGDSEAVILMVEANTRYVGPPTFADLKISAEAIRWAASQSWVDVLSLSLGFPGGMPWDDWESVPAHTRDGVRRGQIVVAGTGNDATPSLTNQVGGPPWVIKAGGVDPSQGGETALASKTPDFVSDFVAKLACSRSMDEECEYMGTSFSTPFVAGSFARAIRELREAVGHDEGIRDGALVRADSLVLTNADLREAVNRTAPYWNVTDYRPSAPPLDRDPLYLPFRVAAPVAPAPWVQMGWGYPGRDLGHAVAEGILSGSLPEKPTEAVAYMRALDAARWEYWGP